MITTLWIIFTFSLIYGSDAQNNKLIGYPGRFYMFSRLNGGTISSFNSSAASSIYAIFELVFAILPPTIVAAALIGRLYVLYFLSLHYFFVFRESYCLWVYCISACLAHMHLCPGGIYYVEF